jgi:hypothetical protein
VPCPGNLPPGEPDIGLPDGNFARVGCGQSIVVDLGAGNTINIAGGEPAFDLVYYERSLGNRIELDWVIIEASVDGSSGWTQIFNWYDGAVDGNTNIGQIGYGSSGEADNQSIPFTDLYNSTGITIDLDAVAPPGNYRYIRIFAPLGGFNDPPQVDALQVLP